MPCLCWTVCCKYIETNSLKYHNPCCFFWMGMWPDKSFRVLVHVWASFQKKLFQPFFFFFKQENCWPTSHRMHLQMRQTPVRGDPKITFNVDDQLTGCLECVWSSAHFLWHEIGHCCVSSCCYWVCFSVILSVCITLFEVGLIFMSWWQPNFTWVWLWRVEELTTVGTVFRKHSPT